MHAHLKFALGDLLLSRLMGLLGDAPHEVPSLVAGGEDVNDCLVDIGTLRLITRL